MQQFESEHYVFHFGENTKAEKDIEDIAAYQEACYRYICKVLKLNPEFKIKYYLCASPEEVGRIYGDNEPCNGFAVSPDTIYAVYNEDIQCIGFHEDAHIISYTINRPRCPAIREGLAMFFDRKWWKIQNIDWTGYYVKNGQYISIDRLLDKELFFAEECSVPYPIMGAFTEWLIATYGIDAYLEMYRRDNIPSAIEEIYMKKPAELNLEFVKYVKLFDIDTALENRMRELLQ